MRVSSPRRSRSGGRSPSSKARNKSSPTTTTLPRTSARGRCGSARRCGRSELSPTLRLRKAAERSLPSALACGPANDERRAPSLLRPRHVVRVSRPPIVRRRVVAPHLRPLRAVLMPRPRLEIAELLVVHQVDVGEELDGDAVGILVIDRDVVPDEVPDRTPEQLDVLACEEVAGAVDLGFVAQLERKVVNVGVVGLQQID